MALVKWRTRCLSSWQVRALPKRKFRKAKEATETCSICLEEFKEGETVRVLPCDHGEYKALTRKFVLTVECILYALVNPSLL